jgi:rhamnosyltransferase
MGEDAIVAAKMLMAGFKKAYVAEATVHHSHSYSLDEEFRRYFDTRVFHEQNKWMIDKFGKPTGEGVKFLKSELYYVFKNDFKSIFKSITSLGRKVAWIRKR